MNSKILIPVTAVAVVTVAVIVKKALTPEKTENYDWIPHHKDAKFDGKPNSTEKLVMDSGLPVTSVVASKTATGDILPAEEVKASESEAVTETMEVIGISEDNIPDAVKLGAGEDEVKPFSKEYKKIIREAQKKAEKNPDYRLRVTGKTYGLGARGKVFVINDVNVVEYDSKDIKKLVAKLEA